jgi:hypothetical protein
MGGAVATGPAEVLGITCTFIKLHILSKKKLMSYLLQAYLSINIIKITKYIKPSLEL